MPDSLAEFIQICVGLLTIATVIWKGGQYAALLKAATDRNYKSIKENTEQTKEGGDKIINFIERVQKHHATEFKRQSNELLELKARLNKLESQLFKDND
ncbi:MAG TPA: hypothetical protein V6D48_24135 [Oculatellaceae cyanobacterium]